MRALPLAVLVAAFHSFADARLLHSIPEDTHAFPKFRVSFLNNLPLINETAERWLSEGLQGGELEFLNRPWKDSWPSHSTRKQIDSGQSLLDDTDPPIPAVADYTLEHMTMGPTDSYICLIPKPTDNATSKTEEEEPSDSELTPARSWSLLQPLSGTCLYHRQGWFTYSYCHNEEIRQFKEAVQTNPHATGAYKPEEDPEWESYTLGKAPKPGADLTLAEQDARAANLELARIAGSQYLVQRWGDGTLCDKTGKSREVEVQFHCSMTMTDTILFVKEAKTCSYVLVVHTPRLCGEPGFRSPRDTSEESLIRCREVVHFVPDVQANVPDTDHPLKIPHRKIKLPPPSKEKLAEDEHKNKLYDEFLRKTLDTIVKKENRNRQGAKAAIEELSDDGQLVIDVLDATIAGGEGEAFERLTNALRAAGFDITDGRYESVQNGGSGNEDNTEEETESVPSVRDEL